MNRIIIGAVILSIVFAACKTDDNNLAPIPEDSVLDYFPLAVGNYWLYQFSSCDSTWENCDSLRVDSNYVSKDTLINGLIYFKLEGKKLVGSAPVFLRDSLDYIVDSDGHIIFSNTDFTSKLSEEFVIVNTDTIYHWFNKMQQEPYEVSVPHGTFNCLDNKMSFFRKKENFEKEYNTHNLYSKGTGPVYESAMFASNTSGVKRELVNFEILDIK